MKENKLSVGKGILAVLALWALTFFGGSILVIFNALSPRAYRFEPGDFGYYIMQIASGPVGFYLGYEAMCKLTPAKSYIFRIINSVIVATFFTVLLLVGIVQHTETITGGLSLFLLAALAGITVYSENLSMKKSTLNEKNES